MDQAELANAVDELERGARARKHMTDQAARAAVAHLEEAIAALVRFLKGLDS